MFCNLTLKKYEYACKCVCVCVYMCARDTSALIILCPNRICVTCTMSWKKLKFAEKLTQVSITLWLQQDIDEYMCVSVCVNAWIMSMTWKMSHPLKCISFAEVALLEKYIVCAKSNMAHAFQFQSNWLKSFQHHKSACDPISI